MKMKKGWPRAAVVPCVALLLAFATVATPAQAQQDQDACRCVDTDGEAIENCSCFRVPRAEDLFTRYTVGAQRPRLGISVDNGQSARHDADGALVTDVLEGGPADEAGLREGDVITRIGDQALAQSLGASAERDFDLDGSVPVQRLLALARDLEPGEEVEIEYERDGQRQTTMLQAEDLSDSWGQSFSAGVPGWDVERFRDQMRTLTDGVRGWQFRSDAPGAGDRDVRFRLGGPNGGDLQILRGGPSFSYGGGTAADGLELVEVNPGLGEYFGAEEGVLIVDVDRSSGLGLEAGDVVLDVGDRSVATPDRFRRIVSSYGQEEDINFRILRDGREMTVTGRLRY